MQDIETFNIVEESMSINISKKKRDDLLDKIKEIRKYIASAPQDENTGNLLLYLRDNLYLTMNDFIMN